MPDITSIGADWISLRDVIRLLLLSALLVLLGHKLFGQNATTKRIYWLCCAALIVAAPWASGTWSIGMTDPPPLRLDAMLPTSAVWAWWAVAALLVGHLGWRVVAGYRHLQGMQPATDERTQLLLRELSGPLPIAHKPQLKVGVGPCSTTLGGNIIALPAGYARWSEATARAVLSHELVHIARRDDRWMLALRLLVCWYWWIPWIHGLHRQFVRAMEESCDDRAARLCGSKTDYVSGVAEVAGRLANDQGSMWARLQGHHLVLRIARFLSMRPQELDVPALYWTILCVTGSVLLLTSMQPVPLQTALPRQSFPVTVSQPEAVQMHVGPRVLVHEIGGSDHHLLFDSSPIYPGRAIETKTAGEVTVSYVVTADGHTSRSRIVSSTPTAVFDGAVLAAVRRLRYEPSHARPSSVLSFERGKDPPGDLSGTHVVRRYQFSVN